MNAIWHLAQKRFGHGPPHCLRATLSLMVALIDGGSFCCNDPAGVPGSETSVGVTNSQLRDAGVAVDGAARGGAISLTFILETTSSGTQPACARRLCAGDFGGGVA
jgi:hypothetical protein